MTNSNMKGRISEIDKGNDTNLTDDGRSTIVDDTLTQPKSHNFLIVTRGRSGSSFLGDLLNSYPGTFYTFEPLHFVPAGAPRAPGILRRWAGAANQEPGLVEKNQSFSTKV